MLVVGARHFPHGHVAGRAGLVVDEYTLTQQLGHLLRGRAGDDLRAAAGREGHNQTDRLGRPGLGMCAGREQAEAGGGDELGERVAAGGQCGLQVRSSSVDPIVLCR